MQREAHSNVVATNFQFYPLRLKASPLPEALATRKGVMITAPKQPLPVAALPTFGIDFLGRLSTTGSTQTAIGDLAVLRVKCSSEAARDLPYIFFASFVTQPCHCCLLLTTIANVSERICGVFAHALHVVCKSLLLGNTPRADPARLLECKFDHVTTLKGWTCHTGRSLSVTSQSTHSQVEKPGSILACTGSSYSCGSG